MITFKMAAAVTADAVASAKKTTNWQHRTSRAAYEEQKRYHFVEASANDNVERNGCSYRLLERGESKEIKENIKIALQENVGQKQLSWKRPLKVEEECDRKRYILTQVKHSTDNSPLTTTKATTSAPRNRSLRKCDDTDWQKIKQGNCKDNNHWQGQSSRIANRAMKRTEVVNLEILPRSSKRLRPNTKPSVEEVSLPSPLKLPKLHVVLTRNEILEDWYKITGQKYSGKPVKSALVHLGLGLCTSLTCPSTIRYLKER